MSSRVAPFTSADPGRAKVREAHRAGKRAKPAPLVPVATTFHFRGPVPESVVCTLNTVVIAVGMQSPCSPLRFRSAGCPSSPCRSPRWCTRSPDSTVDSPDFDFCVDGFQRRTLSVSAPAKPFRPLYLRQVNDFRCRMGPATFISGLLDVLTSLIDMFRILQLIVAFFEVWVQ